MQSCNPKIFPFPLYKSHQKNENQRAKNETKKKSWRKKGTPKEIKKGKEAGVFLHFQTEFANASVSKRLQEQLKSVPFEDSNSQSIHLIIL